MNIVFTDIDGTLLDHNTYSYEKSLYGITLLHENNIPLIPVSSKTEPEIKSIHSELNLRGPFIFENGAGLALFSDENKKDKKFEIKINGIDVESLKKSLHILKKILNKPIKTILEMEINEIIDRTGLTKDRAENSKKRKASLPFVFIKKINLGIEEINVINKSLINHNLVITKGGRFFHFSSINANKGFAIKKIVNYYKKKFKTKSIFTIGIGDSENDIPMLKSVDLPFLVKKYDGSVTDTGLININITQGIGPSGFTEAVKILLKKNS